MPEKRFLDYEGLEHYHEKLKFLLKTLDHGAQDEDIPTEIKNLYGLNDDATLDDILVALRLGAGWYGWRIKVTLPNGDPAIGCEVSAPGLTILDGLSDSSRYTNSKGYVLMRSSSQELTDVTITPSTTDIKSGTISNIVSTGLITNVTTELEFSSNVRVHLQLDDTTPVPDVTINGLDQYGSNPLATDSNGDMVGAHRTSGPVTLSATSPYYNYQSVSFVVEPTGPWTDVTLTLPKSESEYWTFSSTTTVTLSPNVKSIDVTAVGGGGGGGSCEAWIITSGGGGGGGYVQTNLNVSPISQTLRVNVGSGGNAESSGGTTYVEFSDGSRIVTASGGGGANAETGGTGNGKGGTHTRNQSTGGTNGTGASGSGYIFNESILAGGGGGGCGAVYNSGNNTKIVAESAGGFPNGATGGQAAYGLGGGGGGATYGANYSTAAVSGKQGGAGVVYLRWNY